MDPSVPISSVDPSAHLPSLASLEAMDLPERRAALAAWVTWFNGHRDRVSRELEELLDETLKDLDRDEAPPVDVEALQERIDEWLLTAGSVGKGRGPDEEPLTWEIDESR